MAPKMLKVWICRYFGQSKGSSASVELPAAPKPQLEDILKAARKEYPSTLGYEATQLMMLHHDKSQSEDTDDALDPEAFYDGNRHGGHNSRCPIVFRILIEPKLNHVPPFPPAAPPPAADSTAEVAAAVPTAPTTTARRTTPNSTTKRAPPERHSVRGVADQGQRNGASGRHPSRDFSAAAADACRDTDNVLASQSTSKTSSSISQTSATTAAVAMAVAAKVPRNGQGQIIVHCGSNHYKAPGNIAYNAIVRSCVPSYFNANIEQRLSMVDELSEQFEFQLEHGKGPMNARDARDKFRNVMHTAKQSFPVVAIKASSAQPLESRAGSNQAGGGRSNHSSKLGKKKKIIVQCGKRNTRDAGNVAFLAAVASSAEEYAKADQDERKAMLDDFLDRFEFHEGSKRVTNRFARDKVSNKLLRHQFPSSRKRPAPAAAAADNGLEARTSSVAITASSSPASASRTGNNNAGDGRSNHSAQPGEEKIVVQCGQGNTREAGNMAYLAAVASSVEEYHRAPMDERTSMLDGFLDRFEFRQGRKRATEKFARNKVSLAFANHQAASKKRKRPAAAAAAADDEREATTASVAMPPKKRTKQAPHRLPAQKDTDKAGDEEN